MKKLWVRLGVLLELTGEEEELLLGDNTVRVSERQKLIQSIVDDGRFSVDGGCYAPQESVEDFNEEYGTNYPEYDYDFYW